jgi:hypothetical protein
MLGRRELLLKPVMKKTAGEDEEIFRKEDKKGDC